MKRFMKVIAIMTVIAMLFTAVPLSFAQSGDDIDSMVQQDYENYIASGGADADDRLHAILVIKLIDVDRQGRHAHPAGDDRDALVVRGIAGET